MVLSVTETTIVEALFFFPTVRVMVFAFGSTALTFPEAGLEAVEGEEDALAVVPSLLESPELFLAKRLGDSNDAVMRMAAMCFRLILFMECGVYCV